MENENQQINIDFLTQPGFTDFLKAFQISLVVSTYQTGNVFFIGPGAGEQLNICLIKLKRPMGVTAHNNSLLIGTSHQIIKFNNILPRGVVHQGADRFFIPQQIWVTGDQDAHDIAVEKSGRVVFVNTLHSCLATVDGDHSFTPIWKPPVISQIKHEDRCHLNGLALRDGKARYATAFSRTDEKEGWRQTKESGGVVWDIESNKVLAENLSMPHSPRWYADRLWLLESGTGSFGHIDLKAGKFQKIAQLPGYLRGLTFFGDLAFIGSSVPRENSSIVHKPLDDKLSASNSTPRCGVFVLNIKTGQLLQAVTITAGVQEIYDVAVLPNTFSPKALELESEELHNTVNIGPY